MKPSSAFFARVRADGQTYNAYARSINAVQPAEPIQTQHGNQIFIYRNIRTNQIVYSLTRSLNNHAALKQLPFLGKKTVPASIRKDLWLPFALVDFPSPLTGLNAYRKLREFRRLHETSYDRSIITRESGHGKLLNTKERGKILMNQRANSVADLAAVLLQAEKGPSEDRIKYKERSKQHWEKVRKQKEAAGKKVPRREPRSAEEAYGVEGVMIRWADILDAEFAQTWPAQVVHHTLQRHRFTAAFPAYETDGEKVEDEPGVMNEIPEAPKEGESVATAGAT